MLLRFTILFFAGILSQTGSAQVIKWAKALPKGLSENSGLEWARHTLWMHNDGGDAPKLYQLDTNANIVRTIYVKNAFNTDWEDLALDDSLNFYIGDFGNNSNDRKDLRIYNLKNPYKNQSDTQYADTLTFSFENQNRFPPDISALNFDAEAFFYLDSSLFIFTKNRTNPFTGYTYMYRLPAFQKKGIALLLDSFMTGTGLKEQWWISAADVSPDKSKVGLLSSDKLIIFSDFKNHQFFKGKVQYIDLGSFTQKEAFVFINSNEFYVSDEYFPILGGPNLYKGALDKGISGTPEQKRIRGESLITYYKKFGEHVIALIDMEKSVRVDVIDSSGKVLIKHELNRTLPIIVLDLKFGYYQLRISDGLSTQAIPIVIN